MSICPNSRRECPACGETIGATDAGQIHPHKGINGCEFSGHPNRYRGDDSE